MKFMGEISSAIGDPSAPTWMAKHAKGPPPSPNPLFAESGMFAMARGRLACPPWQHVDARAHVRISQHFFSRLVLRGGALLIPQLHPGSLYRCGKSTRERPVGHGSRKGRLRSARNDDSRPNASWSLLASALTALGSCLVTLSRR